jgi:hypothetical protein
LETNQLIAMVLFVTAVLDVTVGLFVVAPRVPEDRRKVMIPVFGGSGLLMLAAGLAFWLDLFGFP